MNDKQRITLTALQQYNDACLENDDHDEAILTQKIIKEL